MLIATSLCLKRSDKVNGDIGFEGTLVVVLCPHLLLPHQHPSLVALGGSPTHQDSAKSPWIPGTSLRASMATCQELL